LEEVKKNKKVLYHFIVFAIVNELLIKNRRISPAYWLMQAREEMRPPSRLRLLGVRGVYYKRQCAYTTPVLSNACVKIRVIKFLSIIYICCHVEMTPSAKFSFFTVKASMQRDILYAPFCCRLARTYVPEVFSRERIYIISLNTS